VQSVITKLFALGLNAATSIIVARVLLPEGRGEMSALIAWASLFTGLLTLGLPSSLIFNLRHKPEAGSRTVGAAFMLAAAIAVLAGVLGYIAIPFWLSKYPPADITYARWFLLSTPIPIINLVTCAALQAEGKFAHANTIAWSGPLVTFLSLIVLGATHALTPVTGGFVYVVGSVPTMLWLLVSLWRDYAPEFRNVWDTWSNLLNYGFRSWGTDLLNTLAGQADLLLIVYFLSPKSMGIYVVSANFARLLTVFQTSAATVLFPRVAARARAEVVSLTGQTLRITIMCAVVGALVLGSVGSFLLRVVYGAEYAASGTIVFRILLCEVVLGGATDVLAQAFMALGRPGVVSIIQGTGIGFGLALMPALIPRFGIVGAALALVVATSIRFVLTFLCFQPLLRSAPPKLVMTRDDWQLAMARVAKFVPASRAVGD
jgi:O-antigen/teichoic acid export membrane protein